MVKKRYTLSMWKAYTDYMKDNPEGYWFKRKLYGWGWTPVTWQGWLVTLAFIFFVAWNGITFGVRSPEPTDAEVVWFLARVFSAAFLMLAIAWRTGEPPKWQWGSRRD